MNLLVTGAFHCTEEQLKRIESLGCNILFQQNESDQIPDEFKRADAVICNGLFLYHNIDEFPNLKLIQLTSAGLDRVPIDKIKERNIKLFNARGVYSVPMAEFALSGVLSLYKKLNGFFQNQKNHFYIKNREINELSGSTVLIVGCGSVGTECAKRFKAFNTTVVAADIVKPQSEIYDEYYNMDKLPDALSKSDIVVLTLPLTDSTRNLFDSKMFSHFKKNAILVNIARGAVVDEDDMIKAILDGTLGGAILDVFETEPLPETSPLWDLDNVILTPHNSFVSPNNGERLFNVVYENLRVELSK